MLVQSTHILELLNRSCMATRPAETCGTSLHVCVLYAFEMTHAIVISFFVMV